MILLGIRICESKIFGPKNNLVGVSEDATALVYDIISKTCIGKKLWSRRLDY